MNTRDLDLEEIERHLIRELQNERSRAHQALLNWGRWVSDCRGIYPKGVVSPSICKNAPTSKWEFDDEPAEGPQIRVQLGPPEKGDKPEVDPYEAGRAESLHDRMFKPGGLPSYLLDVVEVAYGPRYKNVEESRFHKLCSPACSPETFRHRLKECFTFVERFV